MTSSPAQLSLIVGGGDLISGLPGRRLPLLRSVPLLPARSVIVDGRLRSHVTLPGFRKGMKPGNAGRTFPAEVLTTSEVLRILDACGNGYSGCRNRALFTVLWRSGLRISEALALRPKDIDLDAGRATVLHGKNDKRRVVGLDGQTVEVLTGWLERRRELPVNGSHAAFCVISEPTVGKTLWSSCVREALKDTAIRAGVEKRVHPHGLRHTFASELAREGVPINVIQRLLGHSNPAVTAHYINHIEPFEAIEVARSRSWAVAA